MTGYWYCLLTKILAICGFCYLAVNGSPWWGLCCFLLVASVDGEIKGNDKAGSL
jgi:hypothetical protein